MKKNIDYYPHKTEAHRHPKFKMLRSMYPSIEEGWAAEGRFWALNNLIAQSEDCQLNLTKKRNKGVFADELGMSIGEFEQFIEVLCSDDVELLTQIEANIYTTDTVRETYETIATDRAKARKRKLESVKNTSSDEKQESSDEPLKNSPEPDNKVNKSEVNKSELNKSKVENPTFLNSLSHSEAIQKLYAKHTRISDPNKKTHIAPLLELYGNQPKEVTEDEITECIIEGFLSLNPKEGVRVDFLKNGIQAKISAKWEEKLDELKENEKKEGEKHREDAVINEREKNEKKKWEMFEKYKSFYEEHEDLFSRWEKMELLRLIEEKKPFQLGAIIQPKIDELNSKEKELSESDVIEENQ